MDSDGTAIISDGISPAEPFQAIQAMGSQLDWPKRLKMFSRRCAASAVDCLILSLLTLFFLGVPIGASLAFNIWEPAGPSTPNQLSQLIEHALQVAGGLALLNQLYFYTALSECGNSQASPGKILFGLKTTDGAGQGQTFSAVLRRLSVKYILLLVLCSGSYYIVNYGADFIPSLRLETLRMLVDALIIIASFALCIVTDREQTLYDMVSGRLVIEDGTTSVKERLRHFRSALVDAICTLNPFHKTNRYRAGAGKAGGIVAVVLSIWSYISAAAAIVLLVLAARIAMSMNEVESGLKAQSSNAGEQATQHFSKARSLAPGIASIYQYSYVLNDNLDLSKQEAACARLFAVRGNAQDYLARARVLAKQQQYKAAEADFKSAISGAHGALSTDETSTANTELVMIKLEAEAAKMQGSPALPLHTTPFDIGPPDSLLK
jgi:uncharacterized RDD family membrane protein YckC